MKIFKMLFLLIAVFGFSVVVFSGCSGGGSSGGTTTATSTTTSFVGTQPPGDYWSWAITTDSSGSGNFTAVNNTKGLDYSGSVTQLTGNSSGISKLNVTSTTDTNVTVHTSAYAVEVPNTVLMAATAPFYTLDHDGPTQLSIHGPVFAAAQGSCPSTGANVTWIEMPDVRWCPTAGAILATGTCVSPDNAYGTASISVLGSTYTINLTSYHLDGSAGSPVSLSSCTCSEGVIHCTDGGGNPIRIAFTPSGVFFVDTHSEGVAGIVQPASNIDLNDFLANGRSFRGIHYTAWDDFSSGCTSDSDCSLYGGTCLSGSCGIPETEPVSVTSNGTQLIATPYSDIDNGTLNTTGGGTISFDSASQPVPGLIRATLTNSCGSTGDIVMAVRKINNKYVGFVIFHSPCSTINGGFDEGSNALVIEQ